LISYEKRVAKWGGEKLSGKVLPDAVGTGSPFIAGSGHPGEKEQTQASGKQAEERYFLRPWPFEQRSMTRLFLKGQGCAALPRQPIISSGGGDPAAT